MELEERVQVAICSECPRTNSKMLNIVKTFIYEISYMLYRLEVLWKTRFWTLKKHLSTLTPPTRAILDHTPPNFRLFAKIWTTNFEFGLENVPKEFCRTATSCVLPQNSSKLFERVVVLRIPKFFALSVLISTKNSTRLAVSTFLSAEASFNLTYETFVFVWVSVEGQANRATRQVEAAHTGTTVVNPKTTETCLNFADAVCRTAKFTSGCL